MIYGKITLEDWRTACVEGEEPESSFESYNRRLFFFGTLYNRDTLQVTPDDTNAKLADLETTINRVILFKASRMARMFGNNLVFLELDMELFRFLQELPVSLKCKGDSVLDIARGRSVSKYLLKYHYKPLLPEAITSKKKQGGFAPMPLFFRDKAGVPASRNLSFLPALWAIICAGMRWRSFLQIMNKLQIRQEVGSGIGRTRLCNTSIC